MNLELGGPGPGCSAMRVRRLLAGELAGAEAERTLLHVQGCARCGQVQRELLLEQEALRRDVPFPAFAAGVAEKLAVRPRRSLLSRWAPMAAAAGVVLAASVLALRPSDTETVRSKGAATAQLFVQDRAGTRELSAGEPVVAGARLRIALHPGRRTQAAAVLIEPGETSVLYSGAALNGPLPQAFEWTGQGAASLLVVLADEPIDAARIHGVKDAPRGADVWQVQLHR